MTETITMRFHKAETKAEVVKGRRFLDFTVGDKIRTTDNRCEYTIIRDGTGRTHALRADGYFFRPESELDAMVWYAPSDIINGRPREIAGEVMRKTVGEVKVNDVVLQDGNSIRYRMICRPNEGLSLFERLHGGGWNEWPSDMIVTLLGHVTFESAK